MDDRIKQYVRSRITHDNTDPEDIDRFLKKLDFGKFSREENPTSHCCSMLLAYDPDTKEVLLIHHKKANSWFFPGGHVDIDELPLQTAIREAGEELGLTLKEQDLNGPFSFQTLNINNPPQICREHYDIFFGIPVKKNLVNVNMEEFFDYEWLAIEQAKERITLKYYLNALEKFVKYMSW